jgi:hypothetical protein
MKIFGGHFYSELVFRMDSQNEDKARELEELRTRMMKENMFLR